MFQTLVHPTDFDEPSKEAFRITRSLAEALGARVVVFHVVSPPAAVSEDGRVLRNRKDSQPVDVWAEYRALQADTPKVPVQYAIVVGDKGDARKLLDQKIRELGDGVLLVMGSHGRTGLPRLIWGSQAESMVRECACPVLVVKAACRETPSVAPEAEAATSA